MNELIIDRMKPWHIKTVVTVTITICLLIISMSITYDFKIVENHQSKGRVPASSQEDIIILRNRIDLTKVNKWANMYLSIIPDERINVKMEFNATLELHKVKDAIDYFTETNNTYKTSCFGTTCLDILLVQDTSIENAMYVVKMSIENASSVFKNVPFSYEFTTVSSSEGQTLFDIIVTSLTFCVAIVGIVLFFVYNLKKKNTNLYFWCNAILSVGCFILINPSIFLKLFISSYWIDLVDSIFQEIYIFIMIIWTFFQLDHLNLLGINKEYPIRQWIFRSIILISFFISEGIYIILIVKYHNTIVVEAKNEILSDVKSIRDLLEFFLLFWICISMMISFTLIENPINLKRLKFLTSFSGLFAIICIVQMFLTSKSYNNLPIPLCLVKFINTYILMLILICFQQTENNLYYQKEMVVNEYQDNDNENENHLDDFFFV